MIRNIRREYAECVRTFCKSVPPILHVTTEEIDTYFRSCALYLWAYSGQPEDTFGGINLLYTDRQVKLTQQEFEEQISFYRSNPGEAVCIPDFFLRMLSSDKNLDTDNSRRFIAVQKDVLTLCGEYDGAFSTIEGRRMTWLHEQLAVLCNQAGIRIAGSRQPDDSELEKDRIQELGDLVDEYCRAALSICEDHSNDVMDDDVPYPDPMRKTDGPALSHNLHSQEEGTTPGTDVGTRKAP